MPLAGENRTLVAFGLRFIKKTPIVGLRALIEASDLMDEDIDSEKVGFVLAPRLNACGRMGHAADAVELLTSATAEQATVIARRLAQFNEERQRTERSMTEDAARMAEDRGMTTDDRRAIVLAHESWHAGVVGIVCSRLVERYGRPTVLLRREGDLCKGSARSIEGYSIHDALCATASHLSSFGGHDAAAGLTLATGELEAFTAALIEHANAHITIDELTPTLYIDCDAAISEIDLRTVRQIAALSPFGRANPRPRLRLRGATVAEAPRQVGANGRHLTLRLRQGEGRDRRWLRAVWFNGGGRAGDLAAGMRLDAIFEPKLNDWNGRVSVEAVLQDVMVREQGSGVRGQGSGP